MGLKGWYCVAGVSAYFKGNRYGEAHGKCSRKNHGSRVKVRKLTRPARSIGGSFSTSVSASWIIGDLEITLKVTASASSAGSSGYSVAINTDGSVDMVSPSGSVTQASDKSWITSAAGVAVGNNGATSYSHQIGQDLSVKANGISFTLREDLSVSHQSTDSSGGSWNVTGIVVLGAVVVVGVLFFPEVTVGGIIVRGVAAAAA